MNWHPYAYDRWSAPGRGAMGLWRQHHRWPFSVGALARVPANLPQQPVSFAMVQNMLTQRVPPSVVMSLITQLQHANAQDPTLLPILQRAFSGNQTTSQSYVLWGGQAQQVIAVAQGSIITPGGPMRQFGTFTESAPGSLEPIAFAFEDSVNRQPNLIFGIGTPDHPEPMFFVTALLVAARRGTPAPAVPPPISPPSAGF